jgi:3-methyl-2-oxobutanoate hydroxymethyltransferase
LKADARALEKVGVFALVLEAIPARLAAALTGSLKIPTIGIGAGPRCDGQILVVDDLLGMTPPPRPKFVRPYAELRVEAVRAVRAWRDDVRRGRFPGPAESYD